MAALIHARSISEIMADGYRDRQTSRTGPNGLRPLGAFASRSLEPAARARGFATLSLLQEWSSIAGAGLASFTAPDRVIWPKRPQAEEAAPARSKRPQGAVLVLRVDGPRALEVQYRAQQIMERVNSFFGYRAVVELRIVQAPILKRARANRPKPVRFDPDILPESARIEEDGLRKALVKLGNAVAARKG
jgi:hypothetical protein